MFETKIKYLVCIYDTDFICTDLKWRGWGWVKENK